MRWGGDDVRIIGDIVAGSLLVSALRLIIVKGLLEPAAVWTFRAGYQKADQLMGDRLPDLAGPFGDESPPSNTPKP